MTPAPKMFTYVRKRYKLALLVAVSAMLFLVTYGIKSHLSAAHFSKTFGKRAVLANKKLVDLRQYFQMCAALCNSDARFMQSIVFPEVMRYNSLRDGIETESLRTLYVQLGADYADFSIGLFQMKPSFAESVEAMAAKLLPATLLNELSLKYQTSDAVLIRQQRVERLQDEHWQLIYLTAFVGICNRLFETTHFANSNERLQWYATVYNAGFNHSPAYIRKIITADNFYLRNNVRVKKFRYAALSSWYYEQEKNAGSGLH
ncbi:MAG: hypothetical protein EOO03_11685 [Chitinophagaceae bacterium]|nr:MAG: hypothetical protein EOO03_11685 [Chitinophagaceae bacterium]